MKQQPVKVDTGQIKVRTHGTGQPLRKWEPHAPVTVRQTGGEGARQRLSSQEWPRSSGGGAGRRARQPDGKKDANWQKTALVQTAACALILAAVWGVSQSSLPWAQEATAVMKDAVTTEIDLDRSLGKLQFVRDLLPDAAFVFGDDAVLPELTLPCDGVVAVGYGEAHQGLLLRGSNRVTAPADGEVLGISWDGDEGAVRIDHGGGVESVISCLSNIAVTEGQSVRSGEALGTASSSDGEPRVYFEVRIDGKRSDPSALLGGARR